MPLELRGHLLGLGSIVRLGGETASGLFVVLARGAFRPDAAGSEVVPRYLVGPHPFGEAPDQETFPILADEMDEVVFEGYTDAADAAFLADLLDQLENGRRPTTAAEQFTGPLTAIPEAVADATENADATAPDADPFAELRRLLGRDGRKEER